MRLSASFHPPEPARALSAALMRANRRLATTPGWLERYPLGAMSPSARQLAWAVGRRYTGNADHGFAMASLVPAHSIGTLWQLYEAAPTLRALHEAYRGLSGLLLDCMVPELMEGPCEVTLSFQPEGRFTMDRAEEDFRAAQQVKTWRMLLDEEVAPVRVCFTYARPRCTRAHQRALGTTSLRFSQPRFSLTLTRATWERPLPGADPQRFTSHRARLQSVLDAHLASTDLAVRAEELSISLLHRDLSASSIAEALGMSARTLRRRLAASGASLRSLVMRTRARESELLDEAEQLTSTSLPRALRARLLGFANSGALGNARRAGRF